VKTKRTLIVGGGFAGCTIAYLLSKEGFDVTIVEEKSVLGGGCRTEFYHGHPYTFGPHHLLIDKDDKITYDFLSQFLTFRELKHHTMTFVAQDRKFYTYPIHKDEISQMVGSEKIYEELDNRGNVSTSRNFEEYWINSVGQTLYSKFIDSYSKKMWGIKNNREIDDFAFSPKGVALKDGSRQCFEGVKTVLYPIELDGYNRYFDRCVENCNVIFNHKVTNFDLNNKKIKVGGDWLAADIVVNTASLDIVFEYCFGELRYIGRELLKIILPIEQVTPDPYYFIHYAGEEPYTRIVEYKLMTGYKSKETLIGVEFPSNKNKLYPYMIKSEIEKASKYKALFPKDCFTLGRMGKYHYDNMSDVIRDSFGIMDKIRDGGSC